MTANNDQLEEKVLVSNPSLESEINAARINALELKLETLSIITESMWNMLERESLNKPSALKEEMAEVITARAKRDAVTINCDACHTEQRATSGHCSECGATLANADSISPFDY